MKRVVTLLLLGAFLAPYQHGSATTTATPTTVRPSAKTLESVLKRKKKRRPNAAYKRNRHRKHRARF